MAIAADSHTEQLIALDVPATIGAGTVETSARTIEISETEIFLQSDFLWQEGSWVRVRLRLANACSAVARGFVYQVDNDVMRLRVLAMGPSFSALLAQERTLPIKLVA